MLLLVRLYMETVRYRLKYCLKGPLNHKPTNQPKSLFVELINELLASGLSPVKTNKPWYIEDFTRVDISYEIYETSLWRVS